MGLRMEDRPTVGQVPLMIFSYLGMSLFLSGFIMTILAYAPSNSYIMTLIKKDSAMPILGPIVLVIGAIILIVAVFYCVLGQRANDDDDDDD